MRLLTVVAGCLSLSACAAWNPRPVEPTEAATKLEQVTHSLAQELDPAISPDASALAYEVRSTPDSPPHIEVMRLRPVRRGEEPVGDVAYSSGDVVGLEPAWKPDSSGLVFVSNRGGSQRLLELFGYRSGLAPILADAGDVYFSARWPAVSPRGAIAMSFGAVRAYETGWPAMREFDYALGVSELHGPGVTLLGRGAEPAFSPDGKRLALVRVTGGHAHLFIAATDGGGAEQITDGPADDEAPAWSPDGQHLVFCSGSVEGGVPRANLFLVEPDGSGLRQLTEGDRLACHPSWGKDGYIYFHANVTGPFHIWRVRPR
jgi:hypothetical protein